MFGMLWVDVYNGVFLSIPINFAVIDEWDNIRQASINSLINSMQRIGICDQQMHICIPSHVKSIDLGLMILFQLKISLWTLTQ